MLFVPEEGLRVRVTDRLNYGHHFRARKARHQPETGNETVPVVWSLQMIGRSQIPGRGTQGILEGGQSDAQVGGDSSNNAFPVGFIIANTLTIHPNVKKGT
ncbi:MAG TPA: hypothetical protein VGN17_05850 [Bryobacteraceae bacterium]|jgi:hypothetical protein